MGDLTKILVQISDTDVHLDSALIQEILIATQRNKNIFQDDREMWNKTVKVLWINLCQGLERFDDQLLCATCFYTVLSLTEEQEIYLDHIKCIIEDEISIRKNDAKDKTNTSQVVPLMYGIFQSSFLLQNGKLSQKLAYLLEIIFKLLIMMAFEFSKFTFIVFKIINSFKKVCGTDLEVYLYNEENNVKLLNLVNYNWENPITGVRDMNKSIFETLISKLDNEMFNTVLRELNNFYWNKAKYLMLTEIITQSNKDIVNLLNENEDWIDGIISSLSKPGLVSAGADMYFSILKKIKTEMEWCRIFINPVIEILKGDSIKAIENFSNYWCLTTFKSYPSLLTELVQEMDNDKDKKKYAFLCILKQANKLALLKNDWKSPENHNFDVEKIVISSLDHSDTQLRIIAFEILCSSHKKTMPDKLEYDLVLDFMKNNINTDCTVLRINMLKSFSGFLTQMHISYLNYYTSEHHSNTDNLKKFSIEFQNVIISNLKIDGNYQRKITAIKLTLIFLNGISEVPRKKQKQTRNSSKTIAHFLKNENEWVLYRDDFIINLTRLLRDPADDVRENVVQLLLTHYSQEFRQTERMNILIKDALESLRSRFFYDISCGQSMFKLLVNILLEEKVEATFKNIEDVFSFAFNELLSEYSMKKNTLEAIENGKQLHSFISILYVVLETCIQNNYQININEKISELLKVLDGVSNQFVWEEKTATSSDFSKMNDMVEALITTSGYNPSDELDETKLSGLHQIVLNSLWLNVKSSCELSSLLIKLQTNDAQKEECDKALNIISHVLESCRHKGAIEAAGIALGAAIQHLTSLPDKIEISKTPFKFLKNKLKELVQEATRTASVTRRGAGLSIMVHRIVSSDAKKGKPLFHYFMKTILEICNKTEAMPRHLNNIDNERDLPKAIYIHFLTRIVTDSSLASDMMFYSADLAELAFDNLTSPYWQIRNAALQLYGALIQKLIGQKKVAGIDEETVATVACDEFRTHSPKLWSHIQKQLQNMVYEDKVQYHSNLVPILNMLANLAKKYSFSVNQSGQNEADSYLLKSFMTLLDSPIYTVRRLSAKCISNIFDFGDVHRELITIIMKGISENFLHGSLMMVANYNNMKYTDDLQKLGILYYETFNTARHSYLSREIFEDIFQIEVTEDQLQETLVELCERPISPGIFVWAQKRIGKCVLNSPWHLIPNILKIMLACAEYEHYCTYLLEKIDRGNIPEKIVPELIDILLHFQNKLKSSKLWKILYLLCVEVHPACIKDKLHSISKMHNTEKLQTSYKLRYLIPLLAKGAAVSGNESYLRNITKIIDSLSDPEADVDMRYIAAISNNEFGFFFKTMHEDCRIIVIKSAIILVQDEDETVRITSAKFYQRVLGLENSIQPYICLQKILSAAFLTDILSESGISNLCRELQTFIEKNSCKVGDKYNPFSNNSNNIYLEVNVLKQLIENITCGFQ